MSKRHRIIGISISIGMLFWVLDAVLGRLLFYNNETLGSVNPRSKKAVTDLQSTLSSDFSDPYTLEIIDVLKTPEAANQYNIMVTPTAIKDSPPPMRRVFGDLGRERR